MQRAQNLRMALLVACGLIAASCGSQQTAQPAVVPDLELADDGAQEPEPSDAGPESDSVGDRYGSTEFTSNRQYQYGIAYSLPPLNVHTALGDPGKSRLVFPAGASVSIENLLQDRPAPINYKTISGGTLHLAATYRVDGIADGDNQIGSSHDGGQYYTLRFYDMGRESVAEIASGGRLTFQLQPSAGSFSVLESRGIEEAAAQRLADIFNGPPEYISVVAENKVFASGVNCGATGTSGGYLAFFFDSDGRPVALRDAPDFICS